MNNTPLLSGFTFIKNGLSLGYPIAESIKSIAPLCDEVIINVGFEDEDCTKDDGTYEYLRGEFSEEKYIFLKSFWDPEVTKNGLILSQQTNIALQACRGKYCQYIQGDEAIHEDDYALIKSAVAELEKSPEIMGVIFQYLHFYGSTDIIKKTRNVYRREVRLIRNQQGIQSYLDAQGFKDRHGQKLPSLESPARIFHYGWARPSQLMDRKVKSFGKLYHGSEHKESDFNYQRIWGLKPFKDGHPKVMTDWIQQNSEDLDIWSLPRKFEWKNIGLAISDFVESLTGHRIGEYKNFKKVRNIK